ncbi:MAG: GNAT family N-acetyltransferase [Acidimicrobiales bacterium]
MATAAIRPLRTEDVTECGDILESLPEWFGLADANRAYIGSLHELPAFVAVDDDGALLGFVAVRSHTETSAEIEVMAVRRRHHRGGTGRRLVEIAIEWCRDHHIRWLHVKTRGPATYDDDYERTRRFYLAVGFEPLYESLTEWGADDAALIMVMALAGDQPGS